MHNKDIRLTRRFVLCLSHGHELAFIELYKEDRDSSFLPWSRGTFSALILYIFTVMGNKKLYRGSDCAFCFFPFSESIMGWMESIHIIRGNANANANAAFLREEQTGKPGQSQGWL